jgi:hypothetical protein
MSLLLRAGMFGSANLWARYLDHAYPATKPADLDAQIAAVHVRAMSSCHPSPREPNPNNGGVSTMQAQRIEEAQDQQACWCCGNTYPSDALLHLGTHPEVAVCLGCAHYLHKRAGAREDEQRRSPAARVRDVLRYGRDLVIHRGWHRAPIIGPILRRLGRQLP